MHESLNILEQEAIASAHLVGIVPLIVLDVAWAAEDHHVERPERHDQTQPIQRPVYVVCCAWRVTLVILIQTDGSEMVADFMIDKT